MSTDTDTDTEADTGPPRIPTPCTLTEGARKELSRVAADIRAAWPGALVYAADTPEATPEPGDPAALVSLPTPPRFLGDSPLMVAYSVSDEPMDDPPYRAWCMPLAIRADAAHPRRWEWAAGEVALAWTRLTFPEASDHLDPRDGTFYDLQAVPIAAERWWDIDPDAALDVYTWADCRALVDGGPPAAPLQALPGGAPWT